MINVIRIALANQTVRFVLTGGGAAVLLYGLTVLFISLGAPPFPGALAAYFLAFIVAYTVQHAWTFGGQHAHREALPRYIAAQIFAALISALAAKAAGVYGLRPALISLVSTLTGSGTSYVLARFWVFADKRVPLGTTAPLSTTAPLGTTAPPGPPEPPLA